MKEEVIKTLFKKRKEKQQSMETEVLSQQLGSQKNLISDFYDMHHNPRNDRNHTPPPPASHQRIIQYPSSKQASKQQQHSIESVTSKK